MSYRPNSEPSESSKQQAPVQQQSKSSIWPIIIVVGLLYLAVESDFFSEGKKPAATPAAISQTQTVAPVVTSTPPSLMDMVQNARKGATGRIKYPEATYVGETVDLKPHGKGTITYTSGIKYTGDFKEGFFHGWGTCYYNNGDLYEGGWQNGKFDGLGTYIYASGLEVVGEWRDGVCIDEY